MPPMDVSMWIRRGPPSAQTQAGYSFVVVLPSIGEEEETVAGAGEEEEEEKYRYSKGDIPIKVTNSKASIERHRIFSSP